MTAREQIAGYASRLREYSNFALRGVKKVCKACGPRPAGSESERAAQQLMRADLESCCESVALEPFKTAPGAFMLWLRTGICALLLSALAYNLGHAVVSAAVLACQAIFAAFAGLAVPKKQSQNLVGTRAPGGEVKRRLILCGHVDSPRERTYKGALGHICVLVSMVALVFGLVVSAAALVWGKNSILGYILAGLALLSVPAWLFEKKRPTEAANGSLSGCFTAMAAAKLLGDLGLRLENTELAVLCAGSGEYGTRGPKVFAKALAKKNKEPAIETVFVALDTIAEQEFISIYIDDAAGTARHDSAVCALLRGAANTAERDVPYQRRPAWLGASDAAGAARVKLRAACLSAMNPSPPAWHRTRRDTCEALQPRALEACLDILLEAAWQFDQTGLAPFADSKAEVMR